MKATPQEILSQITGPPCPSCGKERTYKTKQGAKKGEGKPCRSCSNSIQQGGTGDLTVCVSCGVAPREVNSYCLPCNRVKQKNLSRQWRAKQYGLDEHPELKECEICGTDKDLVMDHCHDSGNFRGALCRTCNSALGLLKDSPEILYKAYEYLKEKKN